MEKKPSDPLTSEQTSILSTVSFPPELGHTLQPQNLCRSLLQKAQLFWKCQEVLLNIGKQALTPFESGRPNQTLSTCYLHKKGI